MAQTRYSVCRGKNENFLLWPSRAQHRHTIAPLFDKRFHVGRLHFFARIVVFRTVPSSISPADLKVGLNGGGETGTGRREREHGSNVTCVSWDPSKGRVDA